VLITPVMRRRFDKQDKFYDTHGDYPGVVRALADSLEAPLIDLHKDSQQLIETLGVEDSKKIFLWVKPGEFPRIPEGREDNTHFSEYGARRVAGLIADAIRDQNLGLASCLIRNSNDGSGQ
jgi:lysophospholipase L1-like esterase